MTDRLYRSSHDRVIAGVAGGVAEHYDIDPSFVRIVWALLIPLTGFLALFVYLVMALVVPLEKEDWTMAGNPGWGSQSPDAPSSPPGPPGQTPYGADAPVGGAPGYPPAYPPAYSQPSWAPMSRAELRAQRRATRTPVAGIVIGAFLILLGVWLLLEQYYPWFNTDHLWPLFVVGIGVVLLIAAFTRRSGDEHRPTP